METTHIVEAPVQSTYTRYKDTIKACSLNYYYNHKDHCLEANRIYRNKNKEKLAEQQRARRAKKRVTRIEVPSNSLTATEPKDQTSSCSTMSGKALLFFSSETARSNI